MTDDGFGDDDDVMPHNILPYDNPADASASPEEDFVRHVMHLAEQQVEALWRGSTENVRANQIGVWSALWVWTRDVLDGIHRGAPDISRRPPANRTRRMPSTTQCQLDGDNDFPLEGKVRLVSRAPRVLGQRRFRRFAYEGGRRRRVQTVLADNLSKPSLRPLSG